MDDDQESQYCDGSLQDSEKVGGAFGSLETTSVSEERKPTSVNGRLWIKLKISKSGDQLSGEESVHDEEQEHQSPTAKDQPCRICSVCNKGFSSGKALGGHMRIHVQANNKKGDLHLLPINKKTLKKQVDTVNAGGSAMNNIESKQAVCSICGKNFPSMKSLFGHMRCHPEREWRGIQPPSTAKNSTSSSTLSDALVMRKTDTDTDIDHIDSATTATADDGSGSVVDLSVSLSRWSVTAKRGRKSSTASTPPPPPNINGSSLGSGSGSDDHIIIPDVVYDLMMLAQGDDKQRVVDLSEATNSNSLTNKAGNQASECVPPLKKKRRIEAASLVGDTRISPTKKLKIEERGCVDAGNSNTSDGSVLKKMERSKGKAALFEESHQFLPEKPVILTSSGWEYGEDRMEESESKDSDGSIPGEEFNQSCKIDGKMKKKKMRRKMKLRYLETVGHLVNAPPVDEIHKQIPADRYKCSTCNKSFLTHQALGGHRSSHNKVKMINTVDEYAAAAAAAAAAAEGEQYYANPTAADQVDETEECEEAAGSSRGIVAAAAAAHQCQICNKTFPTGQALGGHKRCHWNSPVESQAASPGEASNNGRRILSFDLNEPPAMEDEEGGIESAFTQPHQHAAGYATSSYNSVI